MSGLARLFLDTNVLVYSRDRNELSKGPSAQKLLEDIFLAGRPLVSVQVLSEFFWTVTRKLPIPLTIDEAIAETRRLTALTDVVALTERVFAEALDVVRTHGIPLWDAQIFAAAKLNQATLVMSEDFQHRQTIDGVTFLNPFAPDFDRSHIGLPGR